MPQLLDEKAQTPLRRLARDVRRHIALESSANLFAALSHWIGGALILAILASSMFHLGWSAPGLFGWAALVWIGLVAVHLGRTLPGEQEALHLWDRRTARKGALASAWEFERRSDRLRSGERMHYQRALGIAERVKQELQAGFSWPRPKRTWAILPVALLILTVSGWRDRVESLEHNRAAGEQSKEAHAQAEAVGEVAKKLVELSEQNAGLDHGAKKLATSVQDTARRLQSLEPDSAKDLPAELEEHARQLEEYAQELGKTSGVGQQVEQLAEDLRHSAAQIAKQGVPENPDGKAKPAASSPLAGTRSLDEQPPLLPLEAASNAAPAEAPPNTTPKAPVPGLEPGSEAGETTAPVPGEAPSGAPIPGGAAGMKAARLASQLGGSKKGPAGVPGLEAGTAHRELKREAVTPLPVQKDDQVRMPSSGNGDSKVRDVIAQESKPETARDAEQTNATFHRVEEQVQSGQALPLARREQVNRYFREVRRLTSDL